MLPDSLCIVDVETTGMGAGQDRIIEVALLRIEKGRLIDSFSSLINPETWVSPYVEVLTGIRPEVLETAPTFYQVSDQIKTLLTDAVFVAHNARFDYGFIRSELARLDISFQARLLCTVKLFRSLHPDIRHHNLDSLISHYQLECPNRHRAYDDAHVLWQFLQKATSEVSPSELEEFIKIGLRRRALPPGLTVEDIDAVPHTPGVYLFYSSDNTLLYIGKSINLHERILSHFSGDMTSELEMKISRQVQRIETIPTAGDLSALLLESRLIKQYHPLYNRQLRRQHQLLALKKTLAPSGYFSATTETIYQLPADNYHDILMLFKSKKQSQTVLVDICKEHSLCPKLLGMEGSKGPCFNYHLGLCKGACVGKEDSLRYNLRFLEVFGTSLIKPWPFPGPIVITEYNQISRRKQTIKVNNWCLADKEATLDLDTYRILNRFIKNPSNQPKIHVIRL